VPDVPTDLKPNQQRFAELIIVRECQAYTRDSYRVQSVRIAHAGSSRLISFVKVEAHIDVVEKGNRRPTYLIYNDKIN
jgi:hypothetical protein